MVYKQHTGLNDIFIQALYLDDNTLLKTILDGMKYTRTNYLQSLMSPKDALGGLTPFVFVCLHGNSYLVQMLLDTGVVDINETGENKWTPLHAAAYSGDMKTVQILINSCADCFAKDDNNNIPLDMSTDLNIRNLLAETMRRKNLQKFSEMVIENNNNAPKKERHQRSKSCFANVSLMKLSELKTQLNDRKISNCGDSDLISCEFKQTLKRWNTCADLTAESMPDLTF